MKIKILTVLTVAVLTVTVLLNTDRGVVKSNNFIAIGNQGYYTEANLQNVGESVYIVGDLMINNKGLTYLK